MDKEKYETQQRIQAKRGEYTRERRKKYLYLQHIGKYLTSQRSAPKREFEQTIPQITEKDKTMIDTIPYSYVKTLKKGFKFALLFAFGIIINELTIRYPAYMDLTIGFVLVQIYDYAKHSIRVRLP